ncbi:MAG TPA: methionine ABC transporter ATP-binding protein [Candidatus Avacidaminococcus intestinavium]|uniref:Methionine ABC transporter ATP-binding protein n=1 Tax=Candidatus Avacidaminococcus intestinavium TaxID=2840684 RepID=A0A9D1MPK4_9FIRM|nr:methionine ABC transporter ATP-binding protein [Candidatus Avacidaminococcus intestinavium]
MIELRDIEKTYYTKTGDIHALCKTSLTINAGEIFGVIGQSGAGKSTLIRCINMLETPTNGQVLVDGQDLTAMNESELRKARQSIGMIFQHFNLLSSRTVFDNIAFPLEIQGLSKTEIRKKVEPLLELVGLEERREHYPSQLSGGQKQRVGIARALASSPKVLLCDEATSALDPQTTKSILDLLRDINQKMNLTIVMITHQMQVVKEICDHVAVIENGKIIEEGTMFDLFTNPQTPTTKDFIKSINNMELPELLKNTPISKEFTNGSKLLVRISFIGSSAGEPLISSLVKRCDVDVNILYGNIENIKDTPYGTLLVEISGTAKALTSSMDYLKARNLRIEVIGYVS